MKREVCASAARRWMMHTAGDENGNNNEDVNE